MLPRVDTMISVRWNLFCVQEEQRPPLGPLFGIFSVYELVNIM